MDAQATTPAPQAIMDGGIDYAGLFPPAALALAAAVDEYIAARGGPDARLLGRFVVPATQLGALGDVLADRDPGPGVMPLSVIVRDRSEDDRRAVEAFSAGPLSAQAPIESIEARPADLSGLAWLAYAFPQAARSTLKLTCRPTYRSGSTPSPHTACAPRCAREG
jgi:hypothetical protein